LNLESLNTIKNYT